MRWLNKDYGNKEEATRYFNKVYIPKHNTKFAVAARNKGNLHRPLLPTDDLSRIFTRHLKRVVSKDLVVSYKNTRYQLKPGCSYRYTLRNAKVTVVEDKTGEVTFCYKDQQVPFTIGLQRRVARNTNQVISAKSFTERRVHIPAPDHPWRSGFARR